MDFMKSLIELFFIIIILGGIYALGEYSKDKIINELREVIRQELRMYIDYQKQREKEKERERERNNKDIY